MGVIELITDLEQQDIRLWLEDGQLRFSAPKGGMSEATRLRLKEHKQAIIEFLAQSQKPAGTALAQTDRNLPQVLSCAQERIWFLSQLEPDNIAFHLPVIFSMQGALDIGILEQVLNTLLARHSILRTAYLQTATTTCQQIRAEKTIALNMRHYTHLLDTAQINAIAEQELRRPFNLGEGDVCHHLLVLMPEQQHLLFLTIHHIATDAWSMAIIGNEIAQLYSAFAHRQANPLPPLPVQYADFAVWQRSNLGSIGIQQQLEFWRNTLAGHENLGFPGDFARPAIADNHGASIKFMLGHDTTAALHGLAKQHNTTLFVVLLSLFGSLLYRYSRQQQFCIGTPVAGRSHSQCESLAGCFLNLLALPATYSADTSFAELLEQNRRTTLAAFANQDVPFEEVVRATVNTRNLSVTPLFQVLFSLQNTPFERITRIENIAISTIEPDQLASLYDLSINAKEWAGEIYAELDYKTALFSRQTMQALLDNFYRLIDSVIANPLQLLDSIGFIGAHDQQRQLLEWNNTARRRDSHLTIHALVERQAQQQATASAVHFCGQTLSYGELNSQANQLARHLQQSGIAAGSLVGVLLERSLALPVALLAIIKAGGCYLPLDPAYPQAHLDNIVRDARLEWLLTDDNTVAWQIPQALHTINLAQREHWQMLASSNLPAPTAEKPLFNVIYTSGSSGKPKGVAVSHAALVNRLLWMQETFPLQNHDRVLHKTTYCFDVSVWEIFWPLASGAQLVIAEPDGQRDAAYLHELISGQGISVAHFVPSMLDVFLATGIAGQHASLKYLFCSGETLSLPQTKTCQALYPHCTLVNLYGPTEAAIDVSYHICKPNENTVPIGKPISNTQIYIVDENLQLLPTGAIGELAIAGSGLAEGYLHQPGLTASVFVDNPFTPGTRLYKSGDLARLDHDGRLHFLGRNDQQVKVRGFRVEPGDIENCLHRHPAIERALVHARSQGNSHSITAYFRSRAAVTVQELREHLLQSLPAFMMPDAFVELHAWPLAANGKIDRKALPEPDRGSAAQQPYMAPRNATEQAIADIWAELLKRPEIGIHDNFFELGGHSLLATMAISRLQNEFNVKIPLNQIFQLPTIANFALAIDRAQQNPGSAADNHTPERGQQEGSLE